METPTMPTNDPITQLRALVADLTERQKEASAQGAALILHGESFIDRLSAMLDGRERSGIDPATHEALANSILGAQPPTPLLFITASEGWPESEDGWVRNHDAPWQRMKSGALSHVLLCDRCGAKDTVLFPVSMTTFAQRLGVFGEAHMACAEAGHDTLPALPSAEG